MAIYIQSATHISIQNPLCEDWMQEPLLHNEGYNRSLEPDYKQFINPLAARRMGKLIKRAIATSKKVLQDAQLNMVDAIVTSTGLGCIENTEKFLSAMVRDGEQLLQPTYFMQSTHNTISSQIALNLGCHGYNCTYSHRGTSFECALSDVYQQFLLGKISSALVGAHDEMTSDYYRMLGKIGYWKEGDCSAEILKKSDSKGSMSGETAVSFVLTTEKNEQTLCQLDDVELLYKPSTEKIEKSLQSMFCRANCSSSDVDMLVLGLSGDYEYDEVYRRFAEKYFPKTTIVWFKHLFGESFTSSAFGTYVAAECVAKEIIPQSIVYQKNMFKQPKRVLVCNHFQNSNHAFVLLSR